MTGGAERIGLGNLEAADETSCKKDADQEGDQSADGNAEQEPSLGASPQPRGKTMAAGLRRIHCEFSQCGHERSFIPIEAQSIDLDN